MGEVYLIRRNIEVVKTLGLPKFTYTGTYSTLDDDSEDTPNAWRIKFLTSGTLTFTEIDTNIDVFLVGGGGGGTHGYAGNYNGSGGGGGYTTTAINLAAVANEPYEIVVGSGGSGTTFTNSFGTTVHGGTGGTSSAFTFSAAGGAGAWSVNGGNHYHIGGDGGSGGGNGCAGGGTDGGNGGVNGGTAGKGQGTTTREFGEADGTLYSTGGGGSSGSNGEANTGNGGNSSCAGCNTNGGSGGSGIVIIRNTR